MCPLPIPTQEEMLAKEEKKVLKNWVFPLWKLRRIEFTDATGYGGDKLSEQGTCKVRTIQD